MSNQHAIQPGKATQTATPDPTHATPGKQTLANNHPTGEASIDTGGMGPDKGRFLDEHQRMALVTEYMSDVNAVLTAHEVALTDLRIEKYVEKEAEMPLWASLVLGAFGKFVESGVMSAITFLRHTGMGSVRGLVRAGAEHEAETELSLLSEKHIEVMIGMAVDAGKDVTKPAITAKTAEASTERTEALSFIDMMRDALRVTFTNLRHGPPGTATDAELLALKKTFQPRWHTAEALRDVYKSAIERYLKSHVVDIGRKAGKGPSTHAHQVETRVAWIVIPGAGQRLGYVKREFAHRSMNDAKPGAAYTSEHALSLEDPGTWKEPFGGPQVRRHEDAIGTEGFIGFVEPEFVGIAQERHEQVWQAEPERYALNYNTMPAHLSKVLP